MEHTKHIWRLGLLLVLVIIGFIIGRLFFIPNSYGLYGSYRADDIKDQRAREVIHGGGMNDRGNKCHTKEMNTLREGAHETVQCENCHAPLSTHVSKDKKGAKMAVHKSASLCLRCHEHLVSRPPDFPQITVTSHPSEEPFIKKMPMSKEVCFRCHNAHDPTPQEG